MATEARWLNDEEQEFWRAMLATSRKITRAMDETLLAGSDLSTSEFSVLVALSEAEDCELRLRDLCADLDWDRSRTSHQITRMERRGLVTKKKSPGDARGVVVSLTDEGWRRLEQAAPEHVESVRRLVFDHMYPEDVAHIRRWMDGVQAVNNVPGTPGFTGALKVNPPKK
ncbi:MarR family winged helix-turn-helix transcriptional regulator [Corynebacterium cystitidis]|uniref:DNA-binding transcriptional regulator, MarR family n=1 Tax=Corynebacterium cystitidis DSM 20524 TaxID=1121357 RepID=A0A1H9RZM5_9CORY|nr:MarR family winged helix-turn-helix transcriptional regulator [Corynebacterium cystitidis]WJY82151.1 Organic hydroperoxide resistance transcriptional regulator [Corynebacterium cystitidis DSM 20524]SER78118.1 DNA-binding transcriptional regulator, MarR family [Corynebacterium cystitidis DSM 20524]SNV78547.1 transcriptional regulator, MarR family protein [Corynebacterium cystitidis]